MSKKLLIALTIALFLLPYAVYSKEKARGKNRTDLIVSGEIKKADKYFSVFKEKAGNLKPADELFVIGYLKYKSGDYLSAKNALLKAKEHKNIAMDHIVYFLADSCLKLSEYDLAASEFENLVTNYPDSVWAAYAEWGLAHAEYGRGKHERALDALQKIDTGKLKEINPEEYNLFKADILISLKKDKEAVLVLEKEYFNAASLDAVQASIDKLRVINTKDSARALNKLGTMESKNRLLNELINNYHYEAANALLEDIGKYVGGERYVEIRAGAYFNMRKYEEAKNLYKELAAGRGARSHYYLDKLAKAASRTNDFTLAITTVNKILKGSLNHNERIQYRYKLGFLYMDAGSYEEALSIFHELEKSKYRGPLRKKILWNIAWIYYKTGKYGEAIGYFEIISKSGFGGSYTNKSLYWLARSCEETKEGEKAKDIYRDLIKKNKFGYYGFMASQRLYKKETVPNDWVENIAGLEKTGNQKVHLFEEPKYLYNLGLTNLAQMELIKFDRKKLYGNEDVLAYINLAKDLGLWRMVYVASNNKLSHYLEEFPLRNGLQRFAWECLYPEAYPDTVKKYSGEFGISPYLVYSIMREESKFQADVVSRAGAVGLMQIVPSTGKTIAAKLQIEGFKSGDLAKPYIAIEFGTKYLSNLSKMMMNEKVFVAASYNAGEDAVLRWLSTSNGSGAEEFVEEIPYEETNNYVKKVLTSYWIYESLYK